MQQKFKYLVKTSLSKFKSKIIKNGIQDHV